MMEHFFKWLYYSVLSVLVFFVFWLVTALFISPKNDAEKRGFIPCTEKFVLHTSSCERGQISCLLSGIWDDTKCNFAIIFKGGKNWLKGEQAAPWSNYLFTPKAEAETDAENPYVGVVLEDMQNLEAQRRFVEEKQKELELAKQRKLKLNDKVLMSSPEEDNSKEDSQYIQPELKEKLQESANIDDEAFMEDFSAENEKNTQEKEGDASALTGQNNTNKGDKNDK